MLPDAPSPRPETLTERVRSLLAQEGRPPSRARVAAWIEAGAVRIEGRVGRDPGALVEPGARVSIDLDEIQDAAGEAGAARRPPRRPPAPPPPWLLYRDAQLVVVERGAFEPTEDDPAFARAVSAALPRDGRSNAAAPAALVAVPDPSRVGRGPSLLCTSLALARRLTAAIGEGAVREWSLARRSAPVLGPGEQLALEEGAGSPREGVWVQREDAPLGPPPAGARDLEPPYRLALVLKHPKTNRRLAFEAEEQGPRS